MQKLWTGCEAEAEKVEEEEEDEEIESKSKQTVQKLAGGCIKQKWMTVEVMIYSVEGSVPVGS
jgi:hypothetical protein